MAARHHGGDHAGVAEEDEPLTVADVEAFELVTALGVTDAAIGEDAVYVHRHESHGGEP
jgi:hypothetical protein